MRIRIALLLLFGLAGLSLHAQANSNKIPVRLMCSIESDDSIGDRLCNALRDEIVNSPRYYQAQGEEKVYWVLHMVTTTGDAKNTSSAEAVELTMARNEREYHVTLGVYITSASAVRSQAEVVFDAIDESIRKSLEESRSRN